MEKLYTRRIIGFIDIIGWSEACMIESPRLKNATEVLEIALKNFSEASKPSLVTIRGSGADYFYYTRVGSMSDSLVVSVPTFMGFNLFSATSRICASLLRQGFLTRGGITIGDLYHRDNMVFGPALIEAVKLEREAVFPRLICSPLLLEYLKNDDLETFKRRLIIDHLGSPIVNLFYMEFLPPKGRTSLEYMRNKWNITEIENTIDIELHKFSEGPDRNEKIAAKWHYMKVALSLMLRPLEEIAPIERAQQAQQRTSTLNGWFACVRRLAARIRLIM